MRHFLAASLCAMAILLLYGCIGDSRPAACAGAPASKLANCIYINAVSEQNPFYCYSIQGASQRETCIKDASNPAMKKVLDRSLPSERDAIFGETPPAAKDEMPPPPPSEEISVPAAGACAAKAGTEKDECIKAEAISTKNLKLCEAIAGRPVREACISEIAQNTKNIEACNALVLQNDSNLCRTYSSG